MKKEFGRRHNPKYIGEINTEFTHRSASGSPDLKCIYGLQPDIKDTEPDILSFGEDLPDADRDAPKLIDTVGQVKELGFLNLELDEIYNDAMPEISGYEQGSSQAGELRNAVASLQDRPTRELTWLNESHVRDIAIKARSASEEDKDIARPLMRKILLTVPSWQRAALEIRRNHLDLAYSPKEKPVIDAEARKADERKQGIETEIGQGVSPWLAHVRHNEQGIANPYVVGFYQDDGKIKKLYGQRTFRSDRQIESILFAGRNEAKEVNLLDTKFQSVSDPTILKSDQWDLLPEDLRQRFESGQILVTGGVDTYALSETDISQLAQSDNPRALEEHVKQSTQQTSEGYYLLYYSDHGNDETGRTGVLMQSMDGEMKPVTATVNGREFVIEIKGCGTKTGGFGEMHHRTGRDIITGGAEREQAENEFARLNENNGGDMPKAIGSIMFDNNGYEQGYIIRLTPSTVRASYTGNDVYPEITQPENVQRLVITYAGELANQIYAPNPKILDRSSHSENILIWGDGQTTFTDFSDHVVFNDTNYPHEESHGGYMTPKQMLKYYLKLVKEIPGYTESQDQQSFYDSLATAFTQKGHNLDIDIGDSIDEVTQKIWEQGGMAYQVFKARRKVGFVAEGALHALDQKIKGSLGRDLSLDSEAAFSEKLHATIAGMQKGLELMKTQVSNSEDQETIKRALLGINQGNFLTDTEEVNNVFQLSMKLKHPDDIRKQLISTFITGGTFANIFAPIGDYIKHEEDVIIAAKVSCPDTERTILLEAERELQKKKEHLARTVRDPHTLYHLLTDTEEARRIITFDIYGAQDANHDSD